MGTNNTCFKNKCITLIKCPKIYIGVWSHNVIPSSMYYRTSSSTIWLCHTLIKVLQTHWSIFLVLQYPHLGNANPFIIFLGIVIPSYCQYLSSHIGHMFNTLIGEHLGASFLIVRCRYCKISDGWRSR
jgi:cAMP phosphodiesterase